MPIVKVKNRKFILRWKPEWDIRILVIGIRFRKGKFVSWKDAEAAGFLRGLPAYLTRRDLAHRLTSLVRQKFDPGWLKKHQAYTRTHPPKRCRRSLKDKKKLFWTAVPDRLKKLHGHKAKRTWNPEQERLLVCLAKKHRKTASSIDWPGLMKDRLASMLPKKSLAGLRSHYWSYLTRTSDKRVVLKRRKDALRYKREHYKKYRQSQNRNRKTVQNSVNDLLFSKIELR